MVTPVAPARVVCPSLAVAINCFKLRRYPFEASEVKDKEAVKLILSAVWNQLQEPFDEAWESDEGRGGEDFQGPAEDWARRLAEHIVGMTYNGPGQVYLGNYTRDRQVLRWAQNDADPIYPIVTACQQLVDLSVMFAGFTIDDSGPTFGFNQDGSQQYPLSKLKVGEASTPGNWEPYSEGLRNARSSLAKYPDCGLLTMFAFGDPAAGPGKGAAHIGTVLRVNPDWVRFQFIDTGGMNTAHPEQPTPKFANGECGVYDYHWTSDAWGPKGTKCEGMGTIPRSSFDQALPIGMKRLECARPLGFARFVLGIPGSPNRVLFATRLLPMHVPARPAMNFPLARYLWSLRYLPNRSSVVGYWILYAPQVGLSEEMLDMPLPKNRPPDSPPRATGRAALIDEIVQRRYARTGKKPPDVLDYRDLLPVAIYRTTPDLLLEGGKWKAQGTHDLGIVRALAGWDVHKGAIGPQHNWLTNLPWQTRSGEIALSDSDFADFPYLAGEWMG